MSLLIIQTQGPEHTLATDSYGVIATAAMLDQDVSVAFCGAGVKQLLSEELRKLLTSAIDFGVKTLYVNTADCRRYQVDLSELSDHIKLSPLTSLSDLLQQHDHVLSY